MLAFFKNGYKYFEEVYGISKKIFFSVSILAFALSFMVMITGGQFAMGISDYFANDSFQGAQLIALIQNAIMSVLFVTFFFTRKKAGHPVEGQSFYAAIAKLLGTSLSVGILYILLHPGVYFAASFILISFIFDSWYCVLVYKELKVNGINPLKRI